MNRCIYTAFYNKLASYDHRSSDTDNRRQLLDRCIRSYKLNNPNVDVFVDIIDEPFTNTLKMYFDKMRRIKELNYLYDVLWVDGDTLCLQSIEEIFENPKMCGVSWYEWGRFGNVINGGVVYYPRRYLYNNWDWFVTQWINLLSRLHIDNEVIIGQSKFHSQQEQIPITNLLLKQISDSTNFDNYNLEVNKEKLLNFKMLMDVSYNYNPILMHVSYHHVHSRDFTGGPGGHSTILKKKILHFNTSVNLSDIYHGVNVYFNTNVFCDFILENFIGIIDDEIKLNMKCEDLKISNKNLNIDVNDKFININNPTMGFYKCFKISNIDVDYYKPFGILVPGCFLHTDWEKDDGLVIKNIYSGEETLIKKPN